jgi:hypothetical protein
MGAARRYPRRRSGGSMKNVPLILLLTALPASLLAQAKDHAPTALPSGEKLKQDKPNSESWTYIKPAINLTAYKSVMVDPTIVYTGPDAEFSNISAADRQKFASLLTNTVRTEMARSFPVVSRAGPGVLRLRLTLVGMQATVGGVATATRVSPIGLAMNSIKSVAGKKGTLSGSMLFAVELSDAKTGELQVAALRRRAPDALDIPSTLSTEDTAKAIARDLAKHLRERLDAAVHGKRK